MTIFILISLLVIAATAFLCWVCWHHDLDGGFIVFIIALALEGIIAVAVVPLYAAESYACSEVGKQMGTEHSYGFFKGCWVKDKATGDWILFDRQYYIK
jgi:hypothetical protein